MDYVTVDEFQRQMKLIHAELERNNALIEGVIPEAKVSATERKELDDTYAEMTAGKEANWRDLAKKK